MINFSKISLDNVTWTPLKPGIDCYHCEVLNMLGVVLKVRTDDTDANTEISVQPLQVLDLSSRSAKNSTLQKSQTLAYGQLASGSGSVSIRSER